jgi:hypothetical protein
MHKWRRLAALSLQEQRILLQAAILLPLVAAGRRVVSLRRLQAWLSRALPLHDQVVQGTVWEVIEAKRVARLVQTAANHGLFHPNCLERSLVLWALLRGHGIQSVLRIGVRKDRGRFEAHAWIEVGGVVLNDTNEVGERFVALTGTIGMVEQKTP